MTAWMLEITQLIYCGVIEGGQRDMGREAETWDGEEGAVGPMEAETKANPTGCPFQNKPVPP